MSSGKIVVGWWAIRFILIAPIVPLLFIGCIGDIWMNFIDKRLPRARNPVEKVEK